jgi:uncharacterized protein (TIGR03067 family)
MMNIRNAGLLSLLAAALWLAGCATPPPAAPAAVQPPPPRVDDRMDGVWAPQKAEMAGREFRLPPEFRLEVRGNRFTIRQTARPDAGVIEFLATEPAGLNVIGEEGPTKGRKLMAIYRFNTPNELEICYDLSGATRPTAFESRPDTQLFRITYRRVP